MSDDELVTLLAQADEELDDFEREARAVEKAGIKAFKQPDPEEWMMAFKLSEDDIQEIMDAEFIIDGLVISSHVIVIAAQPGSGKTTILMHEAANMVKAGFRVMYVNMDCGAADVKHWYSQAEAGGFHMITPHFDGGDAVNRWIEGLYQMSLMPADLGELVIVVDTLKKIAEMLDKRKVKATFSLLRSLTAKGATVICAAHTNKHRDDNGDLVYEGTGDVMADCDDLVYLESQKEDDGSQIVSTKPSNKVRGIFNKRSWRINRDRTVEPLGEYLDITAAVRAKTRLEQDATAIEVISQGIRAKHHQRHELEGYCKDNGVGKRAFDRVIRRYCVGETDAKTTPLWRNERQSRDNANYFILVNKQ